MLNKVIAASLIIAPLGAIAPPASAAAFVGQDEGGSAQCDETKKKKRKALGGFLGGMAGNVFGRSAFGGTVGGLFPTGELLSEALIAILDCKEQQQAAKATDDAMRGGVGTTATWTSETRPNVSGSSSVTGREQLADGSTCMTVSDVVIVDGEETTAPKRLCRKPGTSKYVRV
ncbi:hypothetical protein E2493_19025 [Sphingomonas parva]|uniref:Surface antigen domain-containing protein n=1 Tax=Sphingomonas parva TaxID=2555898 RepID=A0A4Y8ZQI0_9SPHN|nr:hypothetical protein [Sphingomonas parva]TFI56646.1 hypothetical protein E2493_19025 [Sphingomonas parva]